MKARTELNDDMRATVTGWLSAGAALLVFFAVACWPGETKALDVSWGDEALQQSDGWYESEAAREIAESILTWQSAEGAWPKNTDLAKPATVAKLQEEVQQSRANTIDNDATTRPMRFLAKVASATGDAQLQSAFVRGLDYLLAAQYPNGGWPQYFPLREGYYSRITFNDNAMLNVMFLLRDVANRDAEFGFVSEGYRERAKEALERGIDVILKSQIRQDGKLTAWCAQYDQITLAPAWARAYEPPSLSGNESVDIVRFLMQIDNPSQEQVDAIEAAVAWMRSVVIRGLRYERFVDAQGNEDGRVVADDSAGPLWARFYDLHTNRPIFTGRDSVIHLSLDEIERERRSGYGYYGTWPQSLLADEYPRWRARAAGQVLWQLDNLKSIAGHDVEVIGDPRVIDTPGGKAVEFDGEDDGLFLDVHPLAGMTEFTVEVTFKPYRNGAFEQRFFHMQESESASRVMFETRLPEGTGKWFLDTYLRTGEHGVPLYAENFQHDIGDWYHAAIVVANGQFSHFVNGALELSAPFDYLPQGEGRTSLGVRINEVSWYRGAIRSIRFTPRAIPPEHFMSRGD